MNERNQELIVDLLAGHLSPDEERAILTRIERDPDLRAEYEAQVSTISVLGATTAPMMTADERATLHASLRRQLHLDDIAVPVVAAPSRWHRWWAPIGGLAVAAAVVVGAVVVLPGALSGSSSDGSLEMASAEISTTSPSAVLADDLAGAMEDEDNNGAGVESPPSEAPESALAGGDSSDAEPQAVDTYETAVSAVSLPYLTDVDLNVLQDVLSSDAESLRSYPPSSASKSAELDTEQMDACLASLRADDPSSEILPIALTTYQDTGSVVISVIPTAGDSFLAVYSVTLCQELARTQG